MDCRSYLGPYLLGPNDENQGIYTGDARELAKAIPDESVDLIFTDPVYQNIEDYRWLAETAARVLKPDSACLVWFDIPNFPLCFDALRTHLAFAEFLHWQRHGHLAPGRTGITVISPCLWMEKGHSKTYKKMANWKSTTNAGPNARTHAWGKPDTLIAKWTDAFTQLGSTVLDFFSGSGVVPAVCKSLGRRWLAFEIDPDTAERARERVRNTQPPLFVMEPEQQVMDFQQG